MVQQALQAGPPGSRSKGKKKKAVGRKIIETSIVIAQGEMMRPELGQWRQGCRGMGEMDNVEAGCVGGLDLDTR